MKDCCESKTLEGRRGLEADSREGGSAPVPEPHCFKLASHVLPLSVSSLLVYLSEIILLIGHMSQGSTRKTLLKSLAVTRKSCEDSFIQGQEES